MHKKGLGQKDQAIVLRITEVLTIEGGTKQHFQQALPTDGIQNISCMFFPSIHLPYFALFYFYSNQTS